MKKNNLLKSVEILEELKNGDKFQCNRREKMRS